MRFFRAFGMITDGSYLGSLRPVHRDFDDKVFVLPFRRHSWGDDGEEMCCTVIAKDGAIKARDAEKCVGKALRVWGLDGYEPRSFSECTLEECFMYDARYSSCGYDESHYRQLLNLVNTYSFVSRNSHGLKDYVVDAMGDPAKLNLLAEATPYASGLLKELERITGIDNLADKSVSANALVKTAASEKGTDPGFAPITYIVEGNAPSDSDEVINLLISAMRSAGRLESSHVFSLDIDNHMNWGIRDIDRDYKAFINHQLIRAIEGNTLVIRYGMLESSTHHDHEAYEILCLLLDLIDSAECNTQIFFSVPERNSELVNRLRRRFNRPMVVIGKDCGTSSKSSSYEKNLELISKMAIADGRRPDESLAILLSKRMRTSRDIEIEDIYREWATYYDARFDFPQYADAIDEAIGLDSPECLESASEKLESLIGLDGIKEHIRNLVLRIEMGRRMMEMGIPTEPFSKHMAFVGSPGTGKTEVARLYAEILREKGVLSEGRIITVSGSSLFNVARAFDSARGSVLFVDEAYGMIGNPDLIAEFIAHMENRRDDTVVILAGYEGHMNALMDSNPGFRSRIQTVMRFPDYTPEEMQRIFAYMCQHQGLALDDEAKTRVRDAMQRAGHRADQGNARFVRKLFEEALGAQQIRLAMAIANTGIDGFRTITCEDIEKALTAVSGTDASGKGRAFNGRGFPTGREELESLIGLAEVKAAMSARMDFAKMQKVKRDAGMDAPFIPMHMAFTGNPGTGKTEVARIVGRILREEGVLSVGDFFECSSSDLVSPMPGASAPMVESLFSKARGSVIFIDEAYSLMAGGENGPGSEAINALIDQMEKLRSEVVVIFAGYKKEIDALISTNPGFRSRVKTTIEFPDYTEEELVEIFHHMANAQGYMLEDGIDEMAETNIRSAMQADGFGNARYVRNILEDAIVNQSVRLAAELEERSRLEDSELRILLAEDLPTAAMPVRQNTIGFRA